MNLYFIQLFICDHKLDLIMNIHTKNAKNVDIFHKVIPSSDIYALVIIKFRRQKMVR